MIHMNLGLYSAERGETLGLDLLNTITVGLEV
jgi:hypothetical protein